MFRRQHNPQSTSLGSSLKRLVGQARAATTASHSTARRPATIPKKWHAISIDARPLSCTTARELRKKRFLSKEAPALPLEGCTKRASCPCRYKHHDDRRGDVRRDGEAGISSKASGHGNERRTSRGRRSGD